MANRALGQVAGKLPAKVSTKVRVVVLGVLGQSPFAGVAWQVLHYLEGLRRLGYDVYYVEDTGEWPYDPGRNTVTSDCGYTLRYLDRLLTWCGLQGRWAYRNAAEDDRVYGLSEGEFSRLFRDAEVIINLTGATVLKEEHMQVPVRVYLETDPVLPQIEVALGRTFTIDQLNNHTHHFTYGENLGSPDCRVPVGPYRYQPTRQPVILDWWKSPDANPAPNGVFTTIASWQQTAKDIEWNGEVYTWSKHHQLLRLIDLPRRTSQPIELALAGGEDQRATLTSHGWRLRDAVSLSRDILPYRAYIHRSRGEFTVAKDQYARLRSGWFSDRSACYLAAGKPVVIQDTGLAGLFPTGRGLLPFTTLEDVVEAIDAINTDYQSHSHAAREIASECFAAETVVGSMMDRLGS